MSTKSETRHDEIINILTECPDCIASGCCFECDTNCNDHLSIRYELAEIRGELNE